MEGVDPAARRWAKAHHEAGHGVIGHEVGRFVRELSIAGHADLSAIIRPGDSVPAKLQARRTLLTLLAGHVAEMVADEAIRKWSAPIDQLVATITARHLSSSSAPASHEDMPRAAQTALKFWGDVRAAERFIAEVAAETEHMVREQWEPIQAVVLGLLDQDVLTGDEFRATIRRWAENDTLGQWPYPWDDALFAQLAARSRHRTAD